MRPIFPSAILFWRLSQIPTWGAESYPTLYRGEIAESGPRLLAYFQNSFLSLEPAERAVLRNLSILGPSPISSSGLSMRSMKSRPRPF